MSHSDIPGFIERIRAVTDEYAGDGGAIFTVAEVGGDEAETEMKAFTEGDARLNSAYGFNFLYADRLTPGLVCAALAEWPDEEGMGWPSWAFENHDAPRAVSRWCAPEHRDAFARMKLLLLACLRGNIILYQGEELGLTQVDIPFEQLQDPEAIANWPLTLSRDGARTPMPWESEGEGGFGAATPWLPLGEENLARSVAVQDADPASLLALTREVIALRNASSALRYGSAVCQADGALLRLQRFAQGERVVCLFNLSPDPISDVKIPQGETLCSINSVMPDSLGPYGALVVRV